jgi:transcriptional/translational regulatory protein YebC/TACO1
MAGTSLESVILEIIMPPNIAIIVDIETDNKARSLQNIRTDLKRTSGTFGSTMFSFTRVGRVVFEVQDSGPSMGDIMDAAIEAGAEDVWTDDEGNTVVSTQPNLTKTVIEAVGEPFGLKVLSSEIVWSPNENTVVKIDDAEIAKEMARLLEAVREYSEVQAIYSNAVKGSISDAEWSEVQEHLDL